MESGNPLLDDYVLGLLDNPRPRVCFLPTASGDADHYIVRFYRAFDSSRCEPSHISLFRRDGMPDDLRAHLLSQDLVYVGGGSAISLLGAWRAHGLDTLIAEAYQRGVVMCGVSAGSLCWFRESLTAFHGTPSRIAGLGLLPYSNTVHFETGGDRDSSYREALADGMCGGFAVEDGAALHFVGDRLARVVTSRPKSRAYRMRATAGGVTQTELASVYLGTPPTQQPALALAGAAL